MGIVRDIAGQRFGSLVAIGIDHNYNKSGHYRANKWSCMCDCGKSGSYLITNLTRGRSLSCGCSRKGNNSTHGLRHTRAYASWYDMIRRCENPSDAGYEDYGGRGITVCERWHKLENFYEDMGERPMGKSIDRIDNDGGYHKENCRWATMKEQLSNCSRNVWITCNNERKTITQWSEITGVKRGTLRRRLLDGWTPESAISTPPLKVNQHTHVSIGALRGASDFIAEGLKTAKTDAELERSQRER